MNKINKVFCPASFVWRVKRSNFENKIQKIKINVNQKYFRNNWHTITHGYISQCFHCRRKKKKISLSNRWKKFSLSKKKIVAIVPFLLFNNKLFRASQRRKKSNFAIQLKKSQNLPFRSELFDGEWTVEKVY